MFLRHSMVLVGLVSSQWTGEKEVRQPRAINPRNAKKKKTTKKDGQVPRTKNVSEMNCCVEWARSMGDQEGVSVPLRAAVCGQQGRLGSGSPSLFSALSGTVAAEGMS